MNDLDPFLPTLVLHEKITNNASRQRERNHTVADCIAHFSLTSPLGQGVPGTRLQRVEQKFGFASPAARGRGPSSTAQGLVQ
jgi:hypothetical protein